ncbi:MAG TPA: hypothetical protein IAA60_09080 [Candidatus Ornithomonoglobus intestinigallinarum]|uniref:Uncharacterized protein n=1 Tax=Candidatus Ornithomonoglobus intestinigallinarum TaxID=2840894 RepID=A0A9D1H4K5_9FIRM|nr:hypothetical protein [Candidatus Ornithomonoglobus intestinigallinarum]
MKFKTKLVSVLAAVSMFAAFGVAANAEGETAGVAQIGDTTYPTIEAAIEAAGNGTYIKLISPIKDMGKIVVDKPVTIDGWGHQISGNSCFDITADGVTIQGMSFRDINDGDPNTSPEKSSGLSAIYASNLTGDLTIKTSVFVNIEYEAIQIVVKSDDANITISQNNFWPTDNAKAKRAVHIEPCDQSGNLWENYNYTAKINDNDFYIYGDDVTDAVLEIYSYEDNDKIDLSNNFFNHSVSACILKMTDVYGKWYNDGDAVYPRYTRTGNIEDEKNNVSYTPAAIALSTYYIEGEYDTLQAAINEAPADTTIRLTKDVTETVTIPEDKTVTLDLNGYTLKNAEADSETAKTSTHTITNNGTLTVIDSSADKSGTVDNVSHGRAAVYNNVGGTVTLNGGKYTRSEEAGNSENDGGNSYYVLENKGIMTINDANVYADGDYSSLVENGWYNGSEKDENDPPSTLTINGGTFSGGINTIKNDDWGILKITNGTFENMAQHALLNWNVTTISGGTFKVRSDYYTAANGYLDATMDKGELTITGGTFTTGVMVNSAGGSNAKKAAEGINISGGTFGADVSGYLADGCAISEKDENNKFTVINPTDDKGTVNSGTYRSAVENGAYEQLWIFNDVTIPETGDVSFKVTTSDTSLDEDDTTLKYETAAVEGNVTIGLIITGIPEDITVTAAPAANSVQ